MRCGSVRNLSNARAALYENPKWTLNNFSVEDVYTIVSVRRKTSPSKNSNLNKFFGIKKLEKKYFHKIAIGQKTPIRIVASDQSRDTHIFSLSVRYLCVCKSKKYINGNN